METIMHRISTAFLFILVSVFIGVGFVGLAQHIIARTDALQQVRR